MSDSPSIVFLLEFIFSQHRIVSNETLENEVKVPAALNLPFGQLFFGFNVAPYVPPPAAPVPSSPSASRVCRSFVAQILC